ncbi:MAG: CGNR zinc finger domain-containing protein [Ilumatobacteraceae bacterium]
MYVRADSLDDEVGATVDAAMELANVILDATEAEHTVDIAVQLRTVLVDHDFLRARAAGPEEIAAFADRCVPLARLMSTLPESDLTNAVESVNIELGSCAIAPSLSAHDGFALHIHWTSATTPFAHQVAVDLLMAIAQTLCDHGTRRFGRCAADDCGRLFYDSTKNRSRRFCADSRCASRTHTAAHRARRASE